MMLIEFKVANFRSIREEQVFSLVASNYEKDLSECLIERKLPGLSKAKFLKGAAIYGANASGKSNLLAAIRFLTDFVKRSATELKRGDPTGGEPFKLDHYSRHKPSFFEITFVAEDIRYCLGVKMTSQKVLEEYLIAYPKGFAQNWYHRIFDEENQTYHWTGGSTGFKQDKTLQERTKDNSLFISVATQWNHPQIYPIFDWFNEKIEFIDLHQTLNSIFTTNMLLQEGQQDKVINLLKNADIGIVDVLAEGEIELYHQSQEGEPIPFNFEREESEGTQRFFSLIGPWIDILENGRTVFIDEIETSLHPLLLKELLKLLFCSDNNPMGAQVIFTTHNPILLNSSLLRRDQIWFTEKTPDGVTHLYPLTDYQPRKDEALIKGYLSGRYGGIPYIPEGLKL